MFTHIIREVFPADFTSYFDTDCFKASSGDYNNTLFIIPLDYRREGCFNEEEFTSIKNEFEQLIDDFSWIEQNWKTYDGKKYTYKMAMEENGLTYSSTKCHKLRELCKTADPDDFDNIAEYLTIKTGETWKTTHATGYCQGDYVNIIYCVSRYDNPVIEGELYLGAGKEFSITELDENGNELDTIYGYYVADCQAWTEEQYTTIVCEYVGLDPENVKIEMIEY